MTAPVGAAARPAELGHRRPEAAHRPAEAADGSRPSSPGVRRQRPRGGRRLGEPGGGGHGRGAVDEVGEDGQPADAVGQHVVEHHDQGRPAVGQVRDDRDPPQRAFTGERCGDRRGGHREERALVTG